MIGLSVSFNPRTYVRCDSADITVVSEQQERFNPRTYVRCDFYCDYRQLMVYCFNPRTYVRCDLMSVLVDFTTKVSIHAPT